jgi:uncharacterized protein (TIGR03066 family)
MRAVLVGVAATALVVALGGTAAGRDAKDGKIDAKLLVGKWTPDDEKKRDKMTIEFTKDGKLALGIKFGEKELKIDGTYKVSGDKLTIKLEFMGEEKSETMTINSLTKKQLVTTDEKGKKDTLLRVEGKGDSK